MKILSLDMGKFKTVWLVYLTGGPGEERYGKIATTPGMSVTALTHIPT